MVTSHPPRLGIESYFPRCQSLEGCLHSHTQGEGERGQRGLSEGVVRALKRMGVVISFLGELPRFSAAPLCTCRACVCETMF